VQQQKISCFTRCNPAADFLDGRVVAVDERHPGGQPGPQGHVYQARSIRESRRQRLLTNYWFALRQSFQ
jgi:hypothetical protein